MKSITLSFLALLSVVCLFAQSPQAFKYQAVARDASGAILADQNVSFRISILEGSAAGTAIYTETHASTTNNLGLVNLEVGTGSVVTGVFEDISWGSNLYFLQIEMDETGGTNYQLMGTSQLLSVPYALHSETTADTTRWRKNATDLYFSSGNVGIGTTTPTQNMEIHSTSAGMARLKLSNQDYSKTLFFGSGNQNYDPAIYFEGAEALRFMKYDQGVGYNELMRIQSAGNIGVGTNSPDPTALIDMSSDSLGFLPPRMTEADRNAIASPAEGLLIYQTDASEGFYYFNGGVWTKLSQKTTSTAQVATPVLTICCQSWMTTNLDVDTYRNGDPIPHVSDPAAWAALTTGAYCYYDNDSATYAAVYGKLYNWYAVNDPRGLAPEGWHIPTPFEWTTLADCLGGFFTAGNLLKEGGTNHWISPNADANNLSCFTGLPGGSRANTGTFIGIGSQGIFWSSLLYSNPSALVRTLSYNSSSFLEGLMTMRSGCSVRCIKD